MSRYQIIEQIAAKIGRAHETIRYTLLEYEKFHPNKPFFDNRSGALNPAQAAELYKLYKQGVRPAELMKHFNRNRSSIYRIVNQQRAKALLAKKIEFIASDEFLQEGAREKILASLEAPTKSLTGLTQPIYIEKRASGKKALSRLNWLASTCCRSTCRH